MAGHEKKVRTGLTLLELLVVVAIIAVLIALLLPAVQRVRIAALRVQSVNNVKQINLAIHGYASMNGYFPAINGSPARGKFEFSFLVGLLPYIEQGNVYDAFVNAFGQESASDSFVVPTYSSPLDPTAPGPGASYAPNAAAFFKRGMSFKDVTDGSSNTIGLAEHYSYDCGGAIFSWIRGMPMHLDLAGALDSRRATFADQELGDVYPVTRQQRSRPSNGISTFQVAPAIADCDPALAQAASSDGMVTGLIDGSVRTLNPGTALQTYWALLTPRGGELPGLD